MKTAYGKIGLRKLRVKKSSKKIEKFTPEKIQKAIAKAGGDGRFASQKTRDIVNKILHEAQTPVITSKKLAKEVIKHLKKSDKKIAQTFEKSKKKRR